MYPNDIELAGPARVVDGRYEVRQLLGGGGMAVVYRAYDRKLGREVALKMMGPGLAQDPAARQRFELEARSVAALNHPGVVAIYDSGVATLSDRERVPYLVMELIGGRTLRDLLLAQGRLPVARAVAVAVDILAALECSHANAVVHRDIKPGNVMLTRGGSAKVVDFGIAWAVSVESARLTTANAVVGTPAYLSPEQARGEPGDHRSDLYATGCVLYEMLAGRPPFAAANAVGVAYQHVHTAPVPPSAINPAIPPPLDAIVLRALAKQPGNRYESAARMRQDIARLGVTATRTMPAVVEAPSVAQAPVDAAGRWPRRLLASGLVAAADPAGRDERPSARPVQLVRPATRRSRMASLTRPSP